MAIMTGDEVIAQTGVNVPTGDVEAFYPAGAILPAAITAGDGAVRTALRSAGSLRVVELATTQADFTTEALADAGVGETADGSSEPTLNDPGGDVVADY